MSRERISHLFDMDESIATVREIGRIMTHMADTASEIRGDTIGWIGNTLCQAAGELLDIFDALTAERDQKDAAACGERP